MRAWYIDIDTVSYFDASMCVPLGVPHVHRLGFMWTKEMSCLYVREAIHPHRKKLSCPLKAKGENIVTCVFPNNLSSHKKGSWNK